MRHAKRESLLIVASALNALGHLCAASSQCRQAASQEGLFTRVDRQTGQKVIGPVLMLLAQTVPSLEEDSTPPGGPPPPSPRVESSKTTKDGNGSGGTAAPNEEEAIKQLTIQAADRALYCVEVIGRDPATRVALVDCEASMNLVLQLPKTSNRALRGRAMAVVLQVVRDGSSAAVVWHNVRQQGDINLAFELLAIGDSPIKAQACAAIKALSTPAIPGQAPQVTAAELVRRGVGPTLIGVLADRAATTDDGARKAQACAAECLVIMTGSTDSHEDLIGNGIAAALPIVLSTAQPQPKAEILNLNSGLQIIKNLTNGPSSAKLWSEIAKLNNEKVSNDSNATLLGLFFHSFHTFLNDPQIVLSGEVPDAAYVLASIPLDVLSDRNIIGHILRVGLPKTLVRLVGEDQPSEIRLACLRALEKLVQHVALARALCNENAVPVILEMLRVKDESDQTRQELAAMLAALTKSDPVRVAESMVSPSGMVAIKMMLGSDQSARTQVAIVGILASMAKGNASVRVAICEAALETVPSMERALVSLGVDIQEVRGVVGATNQTEMSEMSEISDVVEIAEFEQIESSVVGDPSSILRSKTVDILYSGAEDQISAVTETASVLASVTASVTTEETKQDSSAVVVVDVVVATNDLNESKEAPTPTITTRKMAIAALRHIVSLLLNLGELDANRRTIVEKAPRLLDGLVAAMGLQFVAEDGDCVDIRISAMRAFGQFSLAAPVVGTGYGAWQRGYDTLVLVPANSATSTENELTASLDALRTLLSVYPKIASDAPALLKVVGPMAIVATAKDLKIAGLQLLVQMLSSHELVELAFGEDRTKLVRFTEQLVTDLERLRDGMAPSLAALQGGGNDLLCMWSLLTLRALCANVGFRNVLLSSHTSVLGLLSSFESSRNPCIGHIAESTKTMIGGDVDVGIAPPKQSNVGPLSYPPARQQNNNSNIQPPRSNNNNNNNMVAQPPSYGGSNNSGNNTVTMSSKPSRTNVSPPPPPPPSYGGSATMTRPPSVNTSSRSAPAPPSYGNKNTRPPPSMNTSYTPSPSMSSSSTSVTGTSGHQHYPNLGPSSSSSSSMATSRPASNSFSGRSNGSTASFSSPPRRNPSSNSSGSSGGGSKKDTAARTCVEMGFDASRSRQVLEAVGWDVMKAVAVLTDDDTSGGSSGGSSGGGGSSSLGGGRSRSASSPAPPGKKELRFKIPSNVKPGMTVTIADGSSGKRHSVRVPANAKPGTELRIFVDK